MVAGALKMPMTAVLLRASLLVRRGEPHARRHRGRRRVVRGRGADRSISAAGGFGGVVVHSGTRNDRLTAAAGYRRIQPATADYSR